MDLARSSRWRVLAKRDGQRAALLDFILKFILNGEGSSESSEDKTRNGSVFLHMREHHRNIMENTIKITVF